MFFASFFRFFRQYRIIFIRLGYTLFFLSLFRIGALITMPGIEWKENVDSSQNFFALISSLGGGILNRFSFFAIGISPFITASIITQLLSVGIFPFLANWVKQGRKGQIKLNYFTKILALPIGYLQALGTLIALENSQIVTINSFPLNVDLYKFFLCPMILVAGTMVTLLLADLISAKGIGQGTSIVIFAGILASFSQQMEQTVTTLFIKTSGAPLLLYNTIRFFVYLGGLSLIFALIIYLHNSERRLPIQQTGTGLRLSNPQKSYLPIKLNPSGVIPVIFASTLISFFGAVATIIKSGNPGSGYVLFVDNYLLLTSWSGIGVYASLVFIFTLIYAHIAFNSEQLASNFQKSGVYVAGIQGGNRTEQYVKRIVTRLSVFGGFFLSFLAIFSLILAKLLFPDIANSFVVSGTSLLILIIIGQNIIYQIRDLRTQVRYINLKETKKDIFLWK